MINRKIFKLAVQKDFNEKRKKITEDWLYKNKEACIKFVPVTCTFQENGHLGTVDMPNVQTIYNKLLRDKDSIMKDLLSGNCIDDELDTICSIRGYDEFEIETLLSKYSEEDIINGYTIKRIHYNGSHNPLVDVIERIEDSREGFRSNDDIIELAVKNGVKFVNNLKEDGIPPYTYIDTPETRRVLLSYKGEDAVCF